MPDQLLPIAIAVAATLVLLLLMAVLLVKARVQVPGGCALVITRPSGRTVTFQDALVVPFVARAELVDVSVKTVEIRATGREALVCKDGVKVDVTAVFYVRVVPTTEDVLRVVTSVGFERLAATDGIGDLFAAPFRHGLAAAVAAFDFDDIHEDRPRLTDATIQIVGMDLNGFVLDQVAVPHLVPAPIETLDPDDIVDARAIRVMTERAARDNVRTAELRREQQMHRVKLETE